MMTSSNLILATLREQMDILLSWGFHNETTIDKGLQFDVNGFLFKGGVKITQNQEAGNYSIRLERFDGTLFLERADISPFELVGTLDRLIENNYSSAEYEQLVIAEYEEHPRES